MKENRSIFLNHSKRKIVGYFSHNRSSLTYLVVALQITAKVYCKAVAIRNFWCKGKAQLRLHDRKPNWQRCRTAFLSMSWKKPVSRWMTSDTPSGFVQRKGQISFFPHLFKEKKVISKKIGLQLRGYSTVLFMIGLFSLISFVHSAESPLGPILQDPLKITSSFGEYRYDHLHAGLDFSVQSKTGIPVYAPSDSQVVNVGYQDLGYGLHLTLRHHNGSYSRYAHLQDLAEPIWKLCDFQDFRKHPLKKKDFQEECSNSHRIKRGDLIAYTGETGVGPPHLHFEYWDAHKNPINPLTMKILSVPDKSAPVLTRLFIVPIDPSVQINGKNQQLETTPTRVSRNYYSLAQRISASGKIRLKIAGFDTANTDNILGFYRVELAVAGKKLYSLQMHQFGREEIRRMGLVYDIDTTSFQGINYVYKLFSEVPGALKNQHGDGIIQVGSQTVPIKIFVYDSQGNRTTLAFDIAPEARSKISPPFLSKLEPNVQPNEESTIEDRDTESTIELSKGSVLQPVRLVFHNLAKIDHLPENMELAGAATSIIPGDLHLEKNISISLPVPSVSSQNRKRMGLYYLQPKIGLIRLIKTPKEIGSQSRIRFEASRLGTYAFLLDHSSPQWLGAHFNPRGSYTADEIIPAIYIKDAGLGVDPEEVELFINNRRTRALFNKNRNCFILDIDKEELKPGLYSVSIKAQDLAGNLTRAYSTRFRIRPSGEKDTIVLNTGAKGLYFPPGVDKEAAAFLPETIDLNQTITLQTIDRHFSVSFAPGTFRSQRELKMVYAAPYRNSLHRVAESWNLRGDHGYYLYLPWQKSPKPFAVFFHYAGGRDNQKLSLVRIVGGKIHFATNHYNPGEETFEHNSYDQRGFFSIFMDNAPPVWGNTLFQGKKIYETYNIQIGAYLFDQGVGIDPNGFRARIDDKRYPVLYDAKTGLVKLQVSPQEIQKGFRRLRIEAIDRSGNPVSPLDKYFIIRYKKKWIWN